MSLIPQFEIKATAPVSAAFLRQGVTNFGQAAKYIKDLPYGRNPDKTDLLSVFTDQCGTCSTKHALLKTLADENGYPGLRLMLGIFKMHPGNTPSIASTLNTHNLTYIPEAHNYLRMQGHILDYTFPRGKGFDLEEELMKETEIMPGQITDYKVSWHKAFIKEWLLQNPLIPFTPGELWSIREQCIRDMSSS